MTVLERIAGVWFAVLDASAQAAAALASRYSTRQRVSAILGDGQELLLFPEGRTDGAVLGRIALAEPDAPPPVSRLLRRSHVTLELDPARFIFRTIDLPARATDFIEAIVRTQIDRLTPWRPEQVMFGWSPPEQRGQEGTVTLTVAATDKELVAPLIGRVQTLGAAVVVAQVALPAGPDGLAVVVARSTAAAFAVAFWRRCLGITTLAVVALVIGSSLYGQIAAYRSAAAADDIDRETAARRALLAKAASDRDPAGSARHVVEQRKGESPYATLVLDAVSRLLPDDSYVTTFEIAGTRLRLVGFTADAPALIRLLETSALFTGASFFAPTTRLPEDPGDRFNIEATIRPGAFVP